MYRLVSGFPLIIAVVGVACGSSGGESIGEQVYTSQMSGTVAGSQVIAPRDISCDGTVQVTLELDGETGIAGQPLDVMLVLDRSGSMNGQPILDLMDAANAFVDIVDESTDGVLDGVIANGSQIGVVSFAGTATLDQSLTSNAADVKSAVLALVASGSTNHADAFFTAQAAFGSSTNGKILIIMTDGLTNVGGDATDEAEAVRNDGVEIFGIGLGNSIDQAEIESWVSPPVSTHAFFAPSSSDLLAIFQAIGAAITVPAATNIMVEVVVNSHYTVSGQNVSEGALATAGNTLTWTIDELLTETVTLDYAATHDPTQPGGVEILHVVSYSDTEGHMIDFGDATVRVHGCAATLELTPQMDTNTVGDMHTVIATVLDDFGDPVPGITVNFEVAGGPSVADGDPSNPDPAMGSGITDANGETMFTYSNAEASPDMITATVPLQTNVSVQLEDTADKTWEPISAVIDIKPGSFPNSFGSSSRGNIPVALLGAADFDVTLVDDATVRFGDAPSTIGDAPIAHANGHFEEVNSDGHLDKVYHFYFPATNLDPGDTEGCLSGEIDGLDFVGCDSVNITP